MTKYHIQALFSTRVTGTMIKPLCSFVLKKLEVIPFLDLGLKKDENLSSSIMDNDDDKAH